MMTISMKRTIQEPSVVGGMTGDLPVNAVLRVPNGVIGIAPMEHDEAAEAEPHG